MSRLRFSAMGDARAEGFDYAVRGDDVVISHRGARATALRGAAAARFLAEVERDDPQLVMAKATGNFQRGNERLARSHSRNRAR
jgi:hypothetical protein